MNPVRPDEPAADAAAAPGVPRRLVTPRQYLWVAGALAVVSLALHFLGPAITPFLIGAIFAYLGTHRALRERLDPLDQRVACVDVDARVAVGESGRRGGIGGRHRSRAAGSVGEGVCRRDPGARPRRH